MGTSEKSGISLAANVVADETDTDILLFHGSIEPETSRKIIKMTKSANRRGNIQLILVTDGGSADAAYRIARCLQDNYGKFTVFITGVCKSAGTLLAVGANEIVMSDLAELGPLDIQLYKADELWEMSSGLVDLTALSTLQLRAFSMFQEYFLRLKAGSKGRITLKTAMEVATGLMTGLYGPIFSQIDPIRLGEISRAMTIGKEYGERLDQKGKNLKEDALDNLTAGYPSHGFVIDKNEAEGLFINLRGPTDNEKKLFDELGDFGYCQNNEEDFICFLSDPKPLANSSDIVKNKSEGKNGQTDNNATRTDHSTKGKATRETSNHSNSTGVNGKGKTSGRKTASRPKTLS